jgi:tetratricopeptide (TPR) repeat protein
MVKKEKVLSLSLIIIFLGQYYLNASVSDWHGSWGFGMRRFVNCMPILAFGLAALLETLESPRIRFPMLVLAGCIFVIWNLLFLTQFYLGLFPRWRALNFHEMVTQKLIISRALDRKRFTTAANILIERRDFQQAARAVELALELEPGSVDAQETAARYYLATNDFVRAVYYYKKVLEIEERGEHLYGLAVAYYVLGEIPEAIDALERIRDRNKEMVPEAENFLKKLSQETGYQPKPNTNQRDTNPY